jgi:4-hydroxy-tetrahydrodipicolinate synthase
LGLYELPEPEHRLLNAAQVGRIARSKRFLFMKDTCRQVKPFTAKVEATRGTPLKIFQANLKILPPSLEVGCHGFCGWMPIVAPELSAQVCDLTGTPPETRMHAYEKLLQLQTFMVEQGFPASAKYILQRRGVNVGMRCRVRAPDLFTTQNMAALDGFLARQDWFATI